MMNKDQRIGGRIAEWGFRTMCLAAVIIPLLVLATLVIDVAIDGTQRLSWEFISSYPSRIAEQAGVLPALVGSLFVIAMTGLLAIPIGVAAAVYLNEYGKNSWVANIIEINIANLAGVPSVVYGLLGLGLFVRFAGMGRSVLAAACTLALLILPIVIMASREALRSVPSSLREASYGLGATKWETIRQVVLPMALPGILTGTILSISRAIGETAPLIVVGAVAYMTFLPDGLNSSFSVLPIQIYDWTTRPQAEFLINAAAGIMVLLSVMLLLNTVAILLRNKYQKRMY